MMRNNFPFPVWDANSDSPIEGTLFEIPSICQKAKRKSCRRFYKAVADKKGFHECPEGLSCYSTGDDQEDIVTAIRIEDTYNNSKIKNSGDYLPTLPKKLILSSLARSKDQVKKRVHETAGKEEAEGFEDKQLVDFSLHEVRKFNRQIKRYSEEILSGLKSLPTQYIESKAQSIFAASSMISTRLNIYDFEVNPQIITSQAARSANVYKKFDKARRILSGYAKEKSVNLLPITGNSFQEIEIYQVFDFLPFVLIENAIKYSPEHQDVNLEFEDGTNELTIILSSIGPKNSKDELSNIIKKGKRGSNAKIIDESGGGYGLYFATLICDLHEINMIIESGETKLTYNGIEYANFTVTLRIHK